MDIPDQGCIRKSMDAGRGGLDEVDAGKGTSPLFMFCLGGDEKDSFVRLCLWKRAGFGRLV